MLGNWSLGDYFKDANSCTSSGTFLTERVGLDPNRIYVTCFSGDEADGIGKDTESAGIWTELFDRGRASPPTRSSSAPRSTAPRSARRARESRSTARRTGGAAAARRRTCRSASRAARTPEVFYLYPQIEHDTAYGANCHQNCDCGRFIELGNSVFMEYKKTETGFEPLPRKNVDYGGGLARIAAASMDSPDVYRINLLWPIVAKLEELSGRTYDTDTVAMRVIADHLRGATFLAVDGVRPSNKTQGYVMRRLIRRADPLRLRPRPAAELLPGDHPDGRRHVLRTTTRRSPSAATRSSPCWSRRRRRSGRRCARASSSSGLRRGRHHRSRTVHPLRHLRLPGRTEHRGGPPAGHHAQPAVAGRSSTRRWPSNGAVRSRPAR